MTAADILRIIEKGGKLWPSIARITVGSTTIYERNRKW